MAEFFKKRFGYGLVGFFVTLLSLAVVSKILELKEGPYWLLWFLPVGFVCGLIFPDFFGRYFLGVLSRSRSMFGYDNSAADKKMIKDMDETQTGPAVVLVRIVGVLFLIFLLWVVFLSVKGNFK